MRARYIKPRSLAWWASVAPLICGLILASEPLHRLSLLVEIVRNMTGDMPASALIDMGLIGIGLRGAIR